MIVNLFLVKESVKLGKKLFLRLVILDYSTVCPTVVAGIVRVAGVLNNPLGLPDVLTVLDVLGGGKLTS